jgi:hypothetical protein
LTPKREGAYLILEETKKFNLPCGPVELNTIANDKGMSWAKTQYVTRNVPKRRVLFLKMLQGSKVRVMLAVAREKMFTMFKPATGQEVRCDLLLNLYTSIHCINTCAHQFG